MLFTGLIYSYNFCNDHLLLLLLTYSLTIPQRIFELISFLPTSILFCLLNVFTKVFPKFLWNSKPKWEVIIPPPLLKKSTTICLRSQIRNLGINPGSSHTSMRYQINNNNAKNCKDNYYSTEQLHSTNHVLATVLHSVHKLINLILTQYYEISIVFLFILQWVNEIQRSFAICQTLQRMATHSSVLAWRIPGTGEPGGLPSMGSHRVGDMTEAT